MAALVKRVKRRGVTRCLVREDERSADVWDVDLAAGTRVPAARRAVRGGGARDDAPGQAAAGREGYTGAVPGLVDRVLGEGRGG